MLDKARESAKALVAVATPIVSALITDLLLDMSTKSTGWIASVATVITVWLTPNKPKV